MRESTVWSRCCKVSPLGSTLKCFTCELPYKISQLLAQGPVGPPIQNAKLGLGPIQKVQNQLGSWRGPIQKVQNQLGARCKLCESGTLKFFTCQLPYKIFPTSCARPSWASHTKMQNLVSAPYKKFKTSWVVRRAPYKKFKTSWNLGHVFFFFFSETWRPTMEMNWITKI